MSQESSSRVFLQTGAVEHGADLNGERRRKSGEFLKIAGLAPYGREMRACLYVAMILDGQVECCSYFPKLPDIRLEV
jgi:hypothetical protein